MPVASPAFRPTGSRGGIRGHDVEMRPSRRRRHEFREIQGADDRTRKRALRDVVQIGALAFQSCDRAARAACARADRRCRPRFEQTFCDPIVVAVQCLQLGPERNARGAGRAWRSRSKDRDARSRLRQRVAQNKTPFGVGVADLDGLAAARAHDIERPDGVAVHGILDRGNQQAKTDRAFPPPSAPGRVRASPRLLPCPFSFAASRHGS